MRIVAINGSTKNKGNTRSALEIMGDVFSQKGYDYEIINLGAKPISGCLGCGGCRKNQDCKCVLTDAEVVNEGIAAMKDAGAIIIASPVHFSNMSGVMKSFLDRAFMVSGANGGLFRYKVGASVVAVRRTGGAATYSALNYFLSISEMIIATSSYWSVIHGHQPDEVNQDAEGVQTLKQLAENVSWLVQMIEATKDVVEKPERLEKVWTNFVR